MCFLCMVLRCWRDCCKHLGIKILYECGSKLVGERARTPLESWLSDYYVADDAAIMAPTRESIVRATVELYRPLFSCIGW